MTVGTKQGRTAREWGMRDRPQPVGQRSAAGGLARARWWRIFPGEAVQLAVLRRWAEDLLPACPARDDVIEVACELAANAICHTRSGDGGQLGVRIEQRPGLVSVTVADSGGDTEPRLVEDPLAEHGRGLRIVHALSARVSMAGGENGRIVQADVPWAGNDGLDREITRNTAVLHGMFPGAPVWFGQATRQWWAVVMVDGSDRLIGAPSAGELATLASAVDGASSIGETETGL